jgi:diacylglycerol kinase (ATP)
MRFSVMARLRSFHYAFAGFAFMLRTQHNAWLHLIATIVVVGLGVALRVTADDGAGSSPPLGWCGSPRR